MSDPSDFEEPAAWSPGEPPERMLSAREAALEALRTELRLSIDVDVTIDGEPKDSRALIQAGDSDLVIAAFHERPATNDLERNALGCALALTERARRALVVLAVSETDATKWAARTMAHNHALVAKHQHALEDPEADDD